MASEPTIYALSSGAGKAGVAVIRISGGRAGAALEGLTRNRRPPARVATLRTLTDPLTGAELDQALVLWFEAPASFTGEDCAELHVHGGRAVIAGVLQALASLDGCRLAEPGEFTRRAFGNGKLDLTRAEALGDLIDAESAAQRRQALRQMTEGGLGARSDGWRALILKAQALVEAAIDFSDESDVVADAVAQAKTVASALLAELERALDDRRRGEIVREGFRVAIVGAPNVGKSSLLNALSRREVAIVSDEPGTTRDVIEVTLDLGGMLVLVADTAGIRDAEGKVEKEGIRRSFRTIEQSDLVLALTARGSGEGKFPLELHRNLEKLSVDIVRIENKTDLAQADYISSCIGISVLTGDGIDGVLQLIEARARVALDGGEAPIISRERHRILLRDAATALAAFTTAGDHEIELGAEDLRRAAYALGRLTGRVDVEDVLGEIFGRFCIGK